MLSDFFFLILYIKNSIGIQREGGWPYKCFNPPPQTPTVVYSTDRSKAVVPVLVLLFVALWFILQGDFLTKKLREKSREFHNYKPQPFPDPKRKRKPTNLNKHKPNKHTKSTKISSLFPKRGNRNTKRTEKHKNKMTHGKTYNKSPRRINHKATRNKTNTGTTALESLRTP